MAPYALDHRLVVGVASSALFDLTESDEVFRVHGEQQYREYQRANADEVLAPGIAFSFIKRLLRFNDLGELGDPLVEVIILSRNDPETGLRVMKSVAERGLSITRAIFMEGKSPYSYIPALNVSLFLSANEGDVREALALGYPAGRVLPSTIVDDDDDDLRIAFDFDGVLVDDESERVMQDAGLDEFHEHEVMNVVTPHNPGPLSDFLIRVSTIQSREVSRKLKDPAYRKRLHVSIVTARNAPSHERAVQTLRDWGVMVNDGFFLGGIEKRKVLEILRPHIFFDDQKGHLDSSAKVAPSVHIPFGALNALP